MNIKELREFLIKYPGMSIMPSNPDKLILEGIFEFKARPEGGDIIEDSYNLMIIVPMNFPKDLPKVLELENRIPRDYKHHINSDGSLCLGSPIRLIEIICKNPTLIGFVQECLIPYLYSISFKEKYGIHFIFGELEHGPGGIINDCKDLFKLDSNNQVIETFNLVKMKKRYANKRRCPCGCGNRLGKCKFNNIVKKYRDIIPKGWL